jgi:two-component system chemotaxis response regulator CheB
VQLVSDVKNVFPAARRRHAIDLSEAYNLAEHEHPDLVLLCEEYQQFPGLPMFLSLLEALAIEWVFATHGWQTDAIKRQVQLHSKSRPQRSFRSLEKQVQIATGHSKVKTALGNRSGHIPHAVSTQKTVVIGASTGGIEALLQVLSTFPTNCPPTLIVQHIGAQFLPGLAQRLDRHCNARIRVANVQDAIEPGLVLLAPSNDAHLVVSPNGRRCHLSADAPINGHCPSVDALFLSAARALKNRTVGVLLSGMGCDGATGMAAIRKAGGLTIAQDKATCTVYGMPRAALDAGAVDQVLPVSAIGPAILTAACESRRKVSHD